MATWIITSDTSRRRSKSSTKRRQRTSHPNVRSTIYLRDEVEAGLTADAAYDLDDGIRW